MSEFARKQRPVSRSRLARTNAPSQNQGRSLHSLIGNRAMQRMLQREGADQKNGEVSFAEFQSSVIQAINTLGGAVTADYVAQSHSGGLPTAVLRIGKRSHRILPTSEKQVGLMNAGKTKHGTLEGAAQLVYITLQSLPGRSRVTCKVVEVETSVIQSTGKHDFDPSPQGMTDSVMHALVQMGVPWMQSKEPYTGSVSDM